MKGDGFRESTSKMVGFLYLVTLFELLGGIGAWLAAESAIHQILGVLAIGFAFITLALAAILYEIQRASDRLD